MRFTSFDFYDVSMSKMVSVGLGAAAAAWLGAGAAIGGVFGGAEPEILLLISSLVFYIVVSTPRRLFDAQRVAQAREAVLVSASARAVLSVTGSRPRTLIVLRPREVTMASAVGKAARMVLLGRSVASAVDGASAKLASYSAASALRGLATLRPSSLETDDEESRGLASSAGLLRETKLPMFVTVCFFAPIMLLLYAVFSHSYDPLSLAEITAFEFMVVDLAFYLSAPGKGGR